GRYDDRRRARLHPRRPGRPRDGLRRAAAPAQHRFHRLRDLPLLVERLHRRFASPAGPRPDAAALGPRRGRRLRPPHTLQPAPPKPKALRQGAHGHHQPTMSAGAVEARTIGARSHAPALALPARAQDQNMFYGIAPIQSYPFRGSAYVIWDNGPGLTEDPPT